MAGIDYCSCYECGTRLFYGGEGEARHYMASCETTDFVICSKCHNKLKKKIANLEKQLKRGR